MSAPIVSWREGDNSADIAKWSIGTVDAGQESAQKEILIWNNHGGTEDVAHMQDCHFTTTDGESDTLDVVTGKWVYARCDSMDETDFTQVGGEAKKVIGARGAEEGVIQGLVNSGDMVTDEVNFAKLTTFFKSELHGVTAGVRNFKLRVEYFYV